MISVSSNRSSGTGLSLRPGAKTGTKSGTKSSVLSPSGTRRSGFFVRGGYCVEERSGADEAAENPSIPVWIEAKEG